MSRLSMDSHPDLDQVERWVRRWARILPSSYDDGNAARMRASLAFALDDDAVRQRLGIRRDLRGLHGAARDAVLWTVRARALREVSTHFPEVAKAFDFGSATIAMSVDRDSRSEAVECVLGRMAIHRIAPDRELAERIVDIFTGELEVASAELGDLDTLQAQSQWDAVSRAWGMIGQRYAERAVDDRIRAGCVASGQSHRCWEHGSEVVS